MSSTYLRLVLYGFLAVLHLVIEKNAHASIVYTNCMDQHGNGMGFCDRLSIREPPAGYWPNITFLDLTGNSISHLWPDSFDGFPDIEILSLSSNPLKEIDLRIFVGLKKLESLHFEKCQIKSVIPLDNEQTMPNLESLYLDDNMLARIPVNLLNGLTNKTLVLGLSGNPLEFPSNSPFLVSENIYALDLCYTNASGVSAETFQALPNLEILVMANSSLTDLSYKFNQLPSLRHLILRHNFFSEIKSGFLSTNQRLNSIDVSFSSLETIEEAAVKGKTENTILSIEDTPMACQCQYKHILRYFAEVNGKCSNNSSGCYLNFR